MKMLQTTQRQLKVFLIIASFLFNTILGGPDQRRLLKYLLNDRDYNPLERPVLNESNTLPVTMNLALQQIINFDEKNEVIVISGWMVLSWKDYSMVWDAEEFGNITSVRVPSNLIWTPDILLYNSADEKFDSTMKVNAILQHTGDILYVPPGLFKSVCPFNIAAFPFDTQNCTLKFGSWTFDDSGINLTAESNKGQLDAYVKNAEWDLEDFSAVSNALKYDCCPTLYPFVLYTIRMRRRSLYYFTNIVVPCFLISCMTLLGFLLAPDSGEKLTLQITILLSVVMFSLLMSEIMPPSSSAIPIITIYFLCVMFMSTISVVASVIVISVHFRNAENHTMPVWIRKYICHYLAWLMRMSHPRHDLTWRAIRRYWATRQDKPNNINQANGNHHDKSPCVPLLNDGFELLKNNVIDVEQQSLQVPFDRKKERADSDFNFHELPRSNIQRSQHHQDLSKIPHLGDMEMIRSELRIIISQLATFTKHIRKREDHANESQDWKFAAMVIDRLCLIFFTGFMFLFTGLTIMSAPNFLKFQ